MLKIPFKNDSCDIDFIDTIGPIIDGAIPAKKPDYVYIFLVDNWFGKKWLNFSGKALGAFGVQCLKDTTIPPFIPDRIIIENHFKLSDDNSYIPVKCNDPKTWIHKFQKSSENFQNRINLRYPNRAFFWVSGNTQNNSRGSLMCYLPSNDDIWPFYLEFNGKPWKIVAMLNVSITEIKHFQKTSNYHPIRKTT